MILLTLCEAAQGQAFTEFMPPGNLQPVRLISPLQSLLEHDKNLGAGGGVFPDRGMDRLALAADSQLTYSSGTGDWSSR